jgi:DNA polymerase-3 subunit beta
MKFSVPAGVLAAALARLELALDDRSNVMALRMVRLVASTESVALTVDALDRRATVSAAAGIAQTGEAAARCVALSGLVGGLPAEQTVEVARAHTDDISVRAGRSRWIVDGLRPADLPQSAVLADAAAEFTLARAAFAQLIGACQAAMSTEETRYYLNGIYLHVAGGADRILRAVATDGTRLALHDLPLPAGAEKMPGIIVPAPTVTILDKLLRRKPLPEAVTIRASTRLIESVVGDLVLTSKLIDGISPITRASSPSPPATASC